MQSRIARVRCQKVFDIAIEAAVSPCPGLSKKTLVRAPLGYLHGQDSRAHIPPAESPADEEIIGRDTSPSTNKFFHSRGVKN